MNNSVIIVSYMHVSNLKLNMTQQLLYDLIIII